MGDMRQELLDQYVYRIVDNMSTRDLMVYVMDSLAEMYSDYTDEQLVTEVGEYDEDLLRKYPLGGTR